MEYREIKDQIIEKLAVPKDFDDSQNLLELGLNSLQVMRLVNQWRKKGIKVQFGDLLEHPTFAEWWIRIQAGKKKKEEAVNQERAAKAELFKPFPLTEVQYAYKIGRGEDQELGGIGCHAYLEFDGQGVEAERLEKAWRQVQYHHPMLRARFLEDGTQEIMDKPYSEAIAVIDLRSETDASAAEGRLLDIREGLSHRKLNVREGQVAGITLSIMPEGKTRIHFDLDLLVADVQSLQILLRDLACAYMGRALPENSKDWSFAAYLDMQAGEEKADRKKAGEYWRERLRSLPGGPELPLARKPSRVTQTRFFRRIIRLDREIWDGLQQKAAQEHTTPAMLLLSAYAMVLGRWSSTKNFLINIPLFNRKTEYKEIEDAVADFTNLLLLEVDLRKHQTFRQFLDTVQSRMHEDMKYAIYSGVQVQRDLAQMHGGHQSTAPVVFACNLGTPLLNTEFKKNLGEFSYMISQTPQVWLDFQTYEDENGLMLTWDTVDELFPEGMIKDMLKGFEACLHQLYEMDWNQWFDVMPEYQKEFIRKECEVKRPKGSECLHNAFIRIAEEYPDRIALIASGEGETLTYGRLAEEALRTAAFLVNKEVEKSPVAVSLQRGRQQLAAILGILLSGNFYVPVSLNQPEERRKLIHKKTGIYYAITDKGHEKAVAWPEGTTVWTFEEMKEEEPLKHMPDIKPEDTAYIIMTSGTTGLPKGVEISHGSAWNTISDVNSRYEISEKDSALAVSAADFDLSVYDIFGILGSGGRLVLIPEDKSRDAGFWLEQVIKYGITLWNSVPVLLEMLLVTAEAHSCMLPLRKVLLSGDWIGMDLPERVNKLTESCRFISMGGATEASIWSNHIEVKLPMPAHWKSIPYGRPLSNQCYRIVADNGEDAPFWSEGELWIGGCGVAKGYRGDETLTKEKFPEDAMGRWYRTGDKGRFWPDGTIEFLGRKDFQVKIRGHRIELGEIEAALKSVEGVRNAVVEVARRTEGDNYLIAYLETGNERKAPLYKECSEPADEQDKAWADLSQEDVDFSPQQKERFSAAMDTADKNSCSLMLETLTALGAFCGSNKVLTYEQILETCNIAKDQRLTVKSWLKALTKSGYLDKNEEGYKLPSRINKEESNSKIEEAGAAYMERLKPYLPEILSEGREPIEIFYMENGGLTPNDLLNLIPGYDLVIKELIRRLGIFARNKDGKNLRILEYGTRNRRVTEEILASLNCGEIEYTCGDSSLFFAGDAQALETKYPFVRFKALDMQEPEGMQNQEYDCIIAVNSFHRSNCSLDICRHASRLLSPSGILFMAEFTADTCLQEITARVLESGERGIFLPAAEEWASKLSEAGFEKVSCYPKKGSLCGSNIILARNGRKKHELDEMLIREYLSKRLPEYMIPKIYYAIDKLPLNLNGKIDRKALRQSEEEKAGQSIKAPVRMTDTEERLAGLWNKIFCMDGIGIDDNYFVLGGDSLTATRLIAGIKEEFNLELSIGKIFDRVTIREQAQMLDSLSADSREASDMGSTLQAVPDKEHENEPFPLTSVQQAYWIGRSGYYELGQVSTHCYFELDCTEVDILRLQKAWNSMIAYHGMMRAVILPDGRQQILKTVPEYKIEALHLENEEEAYAVRELEEIRSRLSHQVITTDIWPLFEVRVTVMKEGKTRIHISFDNLIFDGWSMFRLLGEWAERYREEKEEYPVLQLSFRDYVLGLEKISGTERYERDKGYWTQRISTLPAAPELPLAKKEEEIKNQCFVRRSTVLSCEEWDCLKQTAGEMGVTPSVLLLTAYGEVLRRWSSNDDFTVNLTQFNREPLHPQTEQLVGDFTTLILLEMSNGREDSFSGRARRVQEQLSGDLDHTLYSAVDVERELKKRNKNIKSSVMPVVFTSGLGMEQWKKGKWVGDLVYNVSQTPQVWLDHQVVEYDGELCLFWDSVDELFHPGMLDEMFRAYVELLQAMSADKSIIFRESRSLVQIPVSKERQLANETKRELAEKTLDELFLEAAALYPEKTAVVSGDYRISYRELKEKALFICRQLLGRQVKREEAVAVLMDKGWEQVLSVYGVLFAGAAYLPLDVNNPAERLKKILKDSNTKRVLVKKDFLLENEWINEWDCIIADGVGICTEDALIQSKQPDALAYIIYTSGSTGLPKGVMITHRGAVNTIADINSKYGITHEDSVLALSNLHFDLSVYDISGVLAKGGKVVIPDSKGLKNPEHWAELMNCEKITLWNTVPAFMEMLLEYNQGSNKLQGSYLRYAFLSGDWIACSLPGKIYAAFERVRVIALGGATEASIWSNDFPVPQEIPDTWKSIPYGKPLANQRFYVLDSLLLDCPEGVPGMLYIAGASVAKGYLNDKEKTEEKFIWHEEKKERLYCTGDMGKYRADGNIEFLGRQDSQVKLNGYRVELGEIENTVKELEGVRNAAAVTDTKNGSRLILAVAGDKELKAETIGILMKSKLPDYMLADDILILEELPLSVNGKIDRNKIIDLTKDRRLQPADNKRSRPKTEAQERVLKIWEEVLEYQNAMIEDNFFESGGNSLQAIKLVNKLSLAFEKEILMDTIFDNPTLQELAASLEENGGGQE
ncbi:yersiniabactin nonribosomal peptide synthetase [Ruminiclostridium sufflavum DSM 19573]|uniref:Yersiniabactin nonribosomal peptide synthetase n=1 Tax=Ruminiclostridium sufflavum DSM 19573 TaxID=1121337 RepID=A0A318XPK9_9FIRM|nr:non-ribosomal peptide synthetase [Ruminiclostridium sufflavum]PYG90251.1 yersiniabactin nonribosomal peptide synthetase [Ruminiclostridium sufflavum DSM 19573]